MGEGRPSGKPSQAVFSITPNADPCEQTSASTVDVLGSGQSVNVDNSDLRVWLQLLAVLGAGALIFTIYKK